MLAGRRVWRTFVTCVEVRIMREPRNGCLRLSQGLCALPFAVQRRVVSLMSRLGRAVTAPPDFPPAAPRWTFTTTLHRPS